MTDSNSTRNNNLRPLKFVSFFFNNRLGLF